jgi:hypothetical protein
MAASRPQAWDRTSVSARPWQVTRDFTYKPLISLEKVLLKIRSIEHNARGMRLEKGYSHG